MRQNIITGQQGFTLLEVLIVIAVLAILTAAGIGYFWSSIAEVSAGSTVKSFVADIEAAKGRAVVGDRGMSWGVRVIPLARTWEFYATSSRSYAADSFSSETRTLPFGVSWIDPVSVPRSVEFAPISGAATPAVFILGYGSVRYLVQVDAGGGVTAVRQ